MESDHSKSVQRIDCDGDEGMVWPARMASPRLACLAGLGPAPSLCPGPSPWTPGSTPSAPVRPRGCCGGRSKQAYPGDPAVGAGGLVGGLEPSGAEVPSVRLDFLLCWCVSVPRARHPADRHPESSAIGGSPGSRCAPSWFGTIGSPSGPRFPHLRLSPGRAKRGKQMQITQMSIPLFVF